LRLSDIFDVRYGHSLELNRLQICPSDEGVAFVSRKSGDNGIVAYVKRIDGIDPAPAGELTCALSGNGVLSTFIQEQEFYTAFHVARLKPKQQMTKPELLYYCICIKANAYRYSFGRQANRTIRDLDLPDPGRMPKWPQEVFEEVLAEWRGRLAGISSDPIGPV
jgi:hypothetical protein